MVPTTLASAAIESWPEVRTWLEYCEGTLLAGGWQLVEAIGRAGRSDNCRSADEVLKECERRGWILKGKYDPSVSQVFFGVGGRQPGRAPKGHTYPQEHAWTPLPALTEYLRSLRLKGT